MTENVVPVRGIRRTLLASWLLWSVGLLALVAPAASARADAGDLRSAPTVTGPSKGGPSREYLDACAQGAAKYGARDFPGAIASFQRAIELSSSQALGHYLLGEAQLASGSVTEAEAAWSRASTLSGEQDATLHARVLFVVADLKERQKRWDDAKAAWQLYLDWAAKFPKANAFPSTAQSRQQVIDTMQKQEKAYEVVRQRIAETKNGNVFTDMSKSPK